MGPVDVFKPHSPVHLTDIAVAEMDEIYFNIRRVVAEIGLNEWLGSFQNRKLNNQHGLFELDYFISCDWTSLVYELGIDSPNTRNWSTVVRGLCGCTKCFLKEEWFIDPFRTLDIHCTIDEYPEAALFSVLIEKRRYDWMHGNARLLSNYISHIHGLFPKGSRKKKEFVKVIQEVET